MAAARLQVSITYELTFCKYYFLIRRHLNGLCLFAVVLTSRVGISVSSEVTASDACIQSIINKSS